MEAIINIPSSLSSTVEGMMKFNVAGVLSLMMHVSLGLIMLY